MSQPIGLFLDFLELYAVVIAAILIVLGAVGLFFEIMNARHPERKIQKSRLNKQKWGELKQAPISIATLSLFLPPGPSGVAR